MRRILLPTDFSPHANAALSHALKFAHAYGGEIHLFHVQMPLGPTSPLIDEYPDDSEARAALTQIDTGGIVDVRQMRRGVTIGPTIVDYADEQDIDLIVMGSHGRRGVPRLLMGSVAEEVVRSAECPVLVVHGDAGGDDALKYDRLLVPVDFSPLTEDQLETAAEMAKRFSSKIELVHAIDPPTMPDFYMPAGTFVLDMRRVTETVYERLG
ncbi:MAG: universal stress protein, partial [Gemmatimonadota bacterium]|nr:universal stress protein [Gemmatimonadota bacterium]